MHYISLESLFGCIKINHLLDCLTRLLAGLIFVSALNAHIFIEFPVSSDLNAYQRKYHSLFNDAECIFEHIL